MTVTYDRRKTGMPADDRLSGRAKFIPFGDSFSAFENSTVSGAHANSRAAVDSGCWHYLLAMVGYQRVSIPNYAGVSGDTTGQMLARIYSDVIAYAPDVVGIQAGRNDFFASFSTPTTVFNNMTAMVDLLLSLGIKVALATCPTSGTSSTNYTLARQQNVLIYNKLISEWAVGKRGLVLLDMQRSIMDQTDITSAAPAANNVSTTDYVHLSGLGCYYFAKDNLTAFTSLFPPSIRRFSPLDALSDSWSYTVLGSGLAAMNGTGGTAGTGASGSIATGFTAQRAGSSVGTGTVAASKVTDRNGNWQRLTITADGSANETVIELLNTTSVHGQFTTNDTLSCMAELKADVTGGASLTALSLRGVCVASATALYSDWNTITTGPPTLALEAVESFTARTPTITMPAAPTSVQQYLQVKVKGTGTVVIDYRNPQLLKNAPF